MGWVPDDRDEAVAAVRRAVAALDELVLADAWDALPEANQRAVSAALEGMRKGLERLDSTQRVNSDIDQSG